MTGRISNTSPGSMTGITGSCCVKRLLYCIAKGSVFLSQAEHIADAARARAAADQQIIDQLQVSERVAEQIRIAAALYADSQPESRGLYRALYDGRVR